jgi:hypothetical protein
MNKKRRHHPSQSWARMHPGQANMYGVHVRHEE